MAKTVGTKRNSPSTEAEKTLAKIEERRNGVRQIRIIVTPWASGHVTVDVVARRVCGGDHIDRRTGHLDLGVDPRELAGCTARDILRLLANAPSDVERRGPGHGSTVTPFPGSQPLPGL